MGKPEKKTPSAAEKMKDPKSSGKKLVQARLPFKILPSSPFEGTKPEQHPSTLTVSSPTRKRKLSYSEHEEAEVKENKVDEPCEIVLLDDSDFEEPKTPGGSSSSCKLKIKLPSSKKKRKSKSFLETKKTTDSDVELVPSEENPQKKAKIEEDETPAVDEKLPVEEKDSKEIPETKTPKQKGKPSSLKKAKADASEDKKSSETPKTRKRGKSSTPPESEDSKKEEEEKSIEENSSKKQEDTKKEDLKKKNATPKTKKRGKSTPPKSEEKTKPEEKEDNVNSESESKPKKDEDESESKTEETITEKVQEEEENSKVQESEECLKEKDDETEVMEIDDDEVVEVKDDEKEQSKDEPSKDSKTPAGKRLRSSLDNSSKATPTNRRSITKDSAKPSTPNSLKKSEQRKQQMKEEREKKIQEEKLQRQKEKEEKEAQKKKEREEKELERKREKEEKEEQRKKEREEKELEKKREREEKEEQKKKEKEEKDQIKQKEKEKKIAEQEAKNEEKRKKEEEDRKKKEEIENKKKKAAEAFTKFFVKPRSENEKAPTVEEPEKEGLEAPTLAFKPFQVRADMNLAPIVRRHLESPDKTNLESVIENESEKIAKNQLYLELIRSGNHVAHKELRHIRDEEEDDCTIIEDELEGAGEKIEEAKKKWYRSKYFRFIENRRPPFYGTWRKSSKLIGPRTPFGKDTTFFDYEIDSDDEWEEEEPGESLHGSDDEKDKEESEDDDYDIDNKWLVPHGHLSDEELGDEDMEDTSREAQKAKLKVLQQEFDQKMKKKTEKLKPRLIGVIWADENGNKPESCPDVIWESLSKRAMIFSEIPPFEEPKEEVDESEEASVSSTPPPQRLEFNDELIKDLIRLVYHNNNSKMFIINEFIAFSSKKYEIEDAEKLGLKKASVREKIDELAEWSSIELEEVGVNKSKKKKFLCWVIKTEHLEMYSLTDIPEKNSWEYILEPKKKISTPAPKVSTPAPKEPESTSTKTAPASGKKRVNILMSVPRGQSIPQQSKNALISNFLQKNKTESSAGGETIEDDQEDDVILLDD
ncbi:CHAF1A family protein [Megaselia abdita]